MTIHKMKLVAPNSLPIVGIKLEDGSLCNFEYSYDDQTQLSLYILTNGNTVAQGTSILVDSDGNEWDSGDVEYHSLLDSK